MLSSGGLNLHRDQVDQWSQWTAVHDRMTLTLICTTFTLSMLNHGLGCPYAWGGAAYRCIDRFLALDSVSRVSARIVYRDNHGLARGVSQGVGPGAHREKCALC